MNIDPRKENQQQCSDEMRLNITTVTRDTTGLHHDVLACYQILVTVRLCRTNCEINYQYSSTCTCLHITVCCP